MNTVNNLPLSILLAFGLTALVVGIMFLIIIISEEYKKKIKNNSSILVSFSEDKKISNEEQEKILVEKHKQWLERQKKDRLPNIIIIITVGIILIFSVLFL